MSASASGGVGRRITAEERDALDADLRALARRHGASLWTIQKLARAMAEGRG